MSGAPGSHPHWVPFGVRYFNSVSFGRFIYIDDGASDIVVGNCVLIIDIKDERWQVCLSTISLNDGHMQILLEDWVIIVLDDVGFDLNIYSLSEVAPHDHIGV